MTCAECLQLMSTEDSRDIDEHAELRTHCAQCADCTRVRTLVVESEREFIFELGAMRSTLPPERVAALAMKLGERRQYFQILTIALLAVSLVVGVIALRTTLLPAARSARRIIAPVQETRTFNLECLAPEQAGELVSPYVRSNGSAYYAGKGALPVLTVRATSQELRQVQAVLRDHDRAERSRTCQLPLVKVK